MTVKDALHAALRERVNPSARAAGFNGSAPNWRRSNEAGDWAIANVQLSSWGDRNHGSCYVNIAVAPAPWLEFQGRARPLPKTLSESYGLFRDRLGTRWEIPSPEAAEGVALQVSEVLEEQGWHLLKKLLNRAAFLDHLRMEGLGAIKQAFAYENYFAKAEAVLLSDHGPSPALDQLLRRMTSDLDPAIIASWQADAAWIRVRAARAGRAQ